MDQVLLNNQVVYFNWSSETCFAFNLSFRNVSSPLHLVSRLDVERRGEDKGEGVVVIAKQSHTAVFSFDKFAVFRIICG